MKKIWWDKAWADYLYWQGQDKKTLKKINSLIKEVERHGTNALGKAELLKGNLSGYCSARIDSKNRLVLKLSGSKDNEVLEIIQCKGHYSGGNKA